MIVNEIWWFDDSWRATECASKIFRASSSSLLGHRSAELAWLFLRQASTLTPLTQHPPSQPCQRMSDECWPPWRHPEAPKCCAQPPQSDQIREADGQKKRTPRFNSCTSCTSCLVIQSSCLCLGIAAENGLFTWTHPWPLQAACLVKLGSIYVLAVFVLAEILLAGWTESCITADSTKSIQK